MVSRAKQNEKIKFILDHVVEEIDDVSKGEVTGIKLRHIKTNKVMQLPADGVFIAIGHKPNTDFLKDSWN